MSPPKACAVCGDKALGYNFSAVTCESCKAFFRRNALAKKQFTCPFNQNCEITVVTRRFCQKCRLKKCIDIGMKSENIMSEEDKMIKRRKIETNRAKRRMMEKKGGGGEADSADDGGGGDGDDDEKTETNGGERAVADSSSGSHPDMFVAACDSQSCGSGDSGTAGGASSSSRAGIDRLPEVNPDLMTSEEMVDFIVCDPDRACQAISKLMRTPKEALSTMEKIISSQKDALRLVSHLIAYPGDGLKIISKIMNSPFNALTVFTKFMSSPTDGLEIISKIMSSPQDVVVFIKNLMQSPEDGLDIMNKFMNTPAEALKMLNRIFNGTNATVTGTTTTTTTTTTTEGATAIVAADTKIPLTGITIQQQQEDNKTPERSETVIQSMLNSNSPQTDASTHIITTSVTAPPLSLAVPTTTTQLGLELPTSPALINLRSPLSNNTTLGDFITPTASPASYAHASPLSAIDSLSQYQSPSTSQLSDELPSTSSSNIHPLPYIAANSPDFDLKTFMQTHYNDETTLDGGGDLTMNSLESVLSEVIRIEYQGFNSLLATSRVKEEQNLSSMGYMSGGCNALRQQEQQQHLQQQQQQQQPICAPSSIIMERDLNEAEQMKLRELRIASEALYDPVSEDLSGLMMGDDRIKPEDTRHNPKLLQLINLTAVAIKRLIKMAKKISAFRDMCQEDQVALLKGGCTEMMIMRSAMIYDDDRNQWKVPHTKENMGNIRADLLKFAEGNVYEEHLKFISTFDEKWRMDENIILIMCAIVLFTPSRPRIIHKDVIRLEQNSYYYLLRRYLESVYSGCEAKNAFIKLIQKISDVERLNKFIINVYLNVNPSQVEPLLREIFDLKNH